MSKSHTFYSRKIVSALIALVLFWPFFPKAAEAQTLAIHAVFSLAAPANLSELEFDFGLKAQPVFGNVYKSDASVQTYQALAKDPRIGFIEQDQTVQAVTTAAADPFFTLDGTQEDRQWYLPKIKIPEAWDYTQGSASTIVAIIDTGIHSSHVELNDGRVIEGFNTLTNISIASGSNSDDNGHGTAVAGVIGAIANNRRGISGINWNVKLMPIKALKADGTGDISSVAAGIVWAADHGANVINLSLGGQGFGPNQALAQAVTYAYNKGALLVAAAGNDLSDHGLNIDNTVVYPICADQNLNMILGVAATDVNDQKASFSNYGSQCVDISAPGKRIITSAFLPSDPSDTVLIYGSGTSLATPIVAAVAALVKSNNPNLSNVEIRDLLMRTADNIDSLNQSLCNGGSCTGLLGRGRINAQAALTPTPIAEGAMLREVSTGNIYLITGSNKRLVSPFVFTQRGFSLSSVMSDSNNQLINFTTITPLPPLEGTLIKAETDATVYVINQELKRPLTFLVFVSRAYSFANVKTLPDAEVAGFATGDWYWPPDGTLVLVKGNPLVYVMNQGVRRPVTFFVFKQRGLSFTKVIAVTDDEFSHVPLPPDNYWLAPLDGTLVKSDADPAVYVIENAAKHVLSAEAFAARGYKFSQIKSLPQAEMDVIASGDPIL